jgi:N-acyl-D-amino-acid deacylase
MKRALKLVLSAIIALSAPALAYAQDYDLVILNGRVMDPETLFDSVANVGIKDGRIVAITKDAINGKDSIDAKGLVVAPGFIDTHVHGVDPFLVKLRLRDGVTTAMDLEAGAIRVGEWYAEKAKTGWQVNYGTNASHPMARLLVHDPEVKFEGPLDFSVAPKYLNAAAKDGVAGWSLTKDTVETMNAVSRLVDEDLRQGALGVSAMPAYMARGLTTYALFEAQRVGARYGRHTAVHTRFHLSNTPPTEAALGFDEVFTNAAVLGAPLLVLHDNGYGWWEIEEKLRLARARGMNMWSEHFPYASGSTIISADFLRPEIWADTYGNKYEETIYDPQLDKFYTRKEFVEMSKMEPARNIVIIMKWREAWLPLWLSVPHMTVASDSISGHRADGSLLPWDAKFTEYAGHPRAAGTHSRTLRMARENGVPLMFSLSQLSYWAALHLGDTGLQDMKDRGRVQVGKVADLTIFDPETVTDNSTYKSGQHGRPATGIPYVIVNGTPVVRDSKVLKDVKPGQPIRFPVEAKGRFVPVDKNRWINEHTVSRSSFPLVDDSGVTKALETEKPARKPQKQGSFSPDLRRKMLARLAELNRGSTTMPRRARPGEFLGSGPMLPHSVFCPIHKRLEPVTTALAGRKGQQLRPTRSQP